MVSLEVLARRLEGEGRGVLEAVGDPSAAEPWFRAARRVEKVARRVVVSVPAADLEAGLGRLGVSVTRWVFRGDLTAFGFGVEGPGGKVWVQCIRLASYDPEEADIDRLERFTELIRGGGWVGEVRGAGWLVAVIRGREEVEVLERVADLVDDDVRVVSTYHNIVLWPGDGDWSVEVMIPERVVVVRGEGARKVVGRLGDLEGFEVVVEDA